MQHLLNNDKVVQLSSHVTIVDPERILNSYYSQHQALPAQWGLQQPYQRPAEKATSDNSTEPELSYVSPTTPSTAVGRKRPLAAAAGPRTSKQPEAVGQQIEPAERQPETAEQQNIASNIQLTVHAHTQLMAAIACAVQASDDVASANAAGHGPDGGQVPAAEAAGAELGRAAEDDLSSAADWPTLAAMKHVLKPRISFGYTNQQGRVQVDGKLFNTMVHNPSNDEVVATAYDKHVLLPAQSSFCMSDLKGITPFADAVQARGGADLLIIDPPWENASAKRAGHYETLTANHLLYIPTKQLLKQQPGSLLALWMTNRPRHHRFVLEKLFPAWGMTHVATWYWLKVTDAGDPISPLHSLHRHPFEQLWLARAGVHWESEHLTTGEQPVPAGLQAARTCSPGPGLSHAQDSQCRVGPDVLNGAEQHTSSQGDCRQAFATLSNLSMTAAKAASDNSRPTQPPDQHVVISVPGQHSRKPHLQLLLLPYVPLEDSQAQGTQQSQLQQPCIAELFARELFPGGMVWGNEVLKFQEMSVNWMETT